MKHIPVLLRVNCTLPSSDTRSWEALSPCVECPRMDVCQGDNSVMDGGRGGGEERRKERRSVDQRMRLLFSRLLVSRLAAPRGSSSAILLFSFVG